MFGITKNAVWAAELSGYSENDITELRRFILDSYYNAFLNPYVEGDIIGEFLQRKVFVDGKERHWRAKANNDYYMERDGIEIFEFDSDNTPEYILALSNPDLKFMWRKCMN